MKMKKKVWLLLYSFLAVIHLAGCGGPADTPAATPIEATSSHTRTPTSSPTPTSSSTPTSTPTPTPASTLTPTITFTPSPTLSYEEMQANVTELLASNGGCQLPCWWGITPGETSWQKANDILARAGLSMSKDSVASNDTWTVYYEYIHFADPKIQTSLQFYVGDDMVDVVNVMGKGVYDPEGFRQVWVNLAPEVIIPIHGKPSRVWVDSDSDFAEEVSDEMPYNLWLFYDHLGFLIIYTGYARYLPTYRMCPTFVYPGNIDYIDIYIKSPDVSTDLESLTYYGQGYRNPLDLTDASGMTIDEFYNLYINKDKPICFETPRDIW